MVNSPKPLKQPNAHCNWPSDKKKASYCAPSQTKLPSIGPSCPTTNPRVRPAFLCQPGKRQIEMINRARTTARQQRVPRILRSVRHWCPQPPRDEKQNGKKQNAGTQQAFRRLNYAFLTLVGKGDAESRHSEILMVA